MKSTLLLLALATSTTCTSLSFRDEEYEYFWPTCMRLKENLKALYDVDYDQLMPLVKQVLEVEPECLEIDEYETLSEAFYMRLEILESDLEDLEEYFKIESSWRTAKADSEVKEQLAALQVQRAEILDVLTALNREILRK